MSSRFNKSFRSLNADFCPDVAWRMPDWDDKTACIERYGHTYDRIGGLKRWIRMWIR